jgi:hypothetical protein
MKLTHDLSRTGILRLMEIDKPIKNVLIRLKNLKKHVDDGIKHNSYLSLASLAHKIHETDKPRVDKMIRLIVKKIDRTPKSNITELLIHVHALGNAGNAAPLDVIDRIAKDFEHHLHVRVAAINGLRK